MSVKSKILLIALLLPVLLGNNTTTAQLFQDSTTMNLIKKDIDCIYNMEFTNAREIYMKINKSYPGHPVIFLLRGLQTYWKNYPLLNTNPAHVQFEEDLRECIRISEKKRIPGYEAEYLLNNLCARGMLLEYYNDNKLTMDVIPLATSTYGNLRKSFGLTNACTDLKYYTGVYNYYREAYPNVFPVYKPLALLFPSGNITTGLKDLHSVAANGVVLRAESYYLLAWIYINFENKYQQAIGYCKSLNTLYPDNVSYLSMYIKTLLILKQYDEAEKIIINSQKQTVNKYFQAQLFIFKGILQEKKYHDYNQAQQDYQSGVNRIAPFGAYGNECASYGYFGLSRISVIKGEKVVGNKLREKAIKLAAFKKINFDE